MLTKQQELLLDKMKNNINSLHGLLEEVQYHYFQALDGNPCGLFDVASTLSNTARELEKSALKYNEIVVKTKQC